ncbi:hypothetical protein [Rugamonas rubra]|uniref:Uncharacterized protein n=1 Tax=Rugamonas rubra TaxID=758825 RepID=A0A1I4URD9_9BURK|nr:hypothetical protein [Rugamonas rubra]SFM91526.1 hypothetical protein SAMN02982985_05768 [Rugamonas rubra]
MSSSERFILTLPEDRDLNVTVFDGHDTPVWQGKGGAKTEVELTKGLYTVRIEANARIDEKNVRLTSHVDLHAFRHKRFSAAPLSGGELTLESHSAAAHAHSTRRTRSAIGDAKDATASLFLFVRAISHATGDNLQTGHGLSLRDASGFKISAFAEREVHHDRQAGWMVYCVDAPPGLYRLVSSVAPKREMPIYLFSGFQTQVFVVQTHRMLLENMRVLMERRSAGFHPEARTAHIADAAMEGFTNSSVQLSEEAETILLRGKFDNPMLGLIGAYTMMRRLRSTSQSEGDRDNDILALDATLSNLRMLIPDAPDIHALEVLRSELLDAPFPPFRFRAPPMFRMGLNAVIRATASDATLIVARSLCDRITTRLQADSPWSTWEALPAARKNPALKFQPSNPDGFDMEAFTSSAIARFPATTSVGSGGLGGWQRYQERSYFQPAAAQALTIAKVRTLQSKDPSWVQVAYLDAVSYEKNRMQRTPNSAKSVQINVVHFARENGITPAAVRREVRQLDKLTPAKLASIIKQHRLLLDEEPAADGKGVFSQMLVSDG